MFDIILWELCVCVCCVEEIGGGEVHSALEHINPAMCVRVVVISKEEVEGVEEEEEMHLTIYILFAFVRPKSQYVCEGEDQSAPTIRSSVGVLRKSVLDFLRDMREIICTRCKRCYVFHIYIYIYFIAKQTKKKTRALNRQD